jgi:hypothetical protein
VPATCPYPEHLYPFPNENSKKKKAWCVSLSGVVRLGEHNTNTDPDCEFDVSADPLPDYTPAELRVRTAYGKPQFKHGISLIRLDRHVVYSRNLQAAVGTAFLSVAAATAVLFR